MTHPALANDAMDRMLANDPIDPIDNADPTEPMDRTELREPIDRSELVEPMLQREVRSATALSSRGLHALLAKGGLEVARGRRSDHEDCPAAGEGAGEPQQIRTRIGIDEREACPGLDAAS